VSWGQRAVEDGGGGGVSQSDPGQKRIEKQAFWIALLVPVLNVGYAVAVAYLHLTHPHVVSSDTTACPEPVLANCPESVLANASFCFIHPFECEHSKRIGCAVFSSAIMPMQVSKNGLFEPCIKMMILPRQARDKHRENSKKSGVFLQKGLRVRRCDHVCRWLHFRRLFRQLHLQVWICPLCGALSRRQHERHRRENHLNASFSLNFF
jgi:hypothetical protein